jgi:hypothetical protein
VGLSTADLPRLRLEVQGCVDEFVKDWQAMH